MSIFSPKRQTEAKARSKRAWPFRLLAFMTILMGMLLASPQVEAAEPTQSGPPPSYPIQKLDDGSYVVKGAIFVKAETGFKLPENFKGYKWEVIKSIDLPSKRSNPPLSMKASPNSGQKAILYQIKTTSENPKLPQTLTEYNQLTDQLEENSPVECASPDYVAGSPNTRAGGFSAGSEVGLPNANDADFEGQWAFNQFRSFRSPDGGQNVEVLVFDGFRSDAAKHWQAENKVNFNAITVTPIDLVPDPDLELPDMPEHGEMIISQIRYLAPAATILPVHVLNDKLLGDTMTLIEGLRKVIERKEDDPDRKMVVNMSLGVKASPQNKRCDIQTMNKLLNTAKAQGIVVVAAAGNDADDAPVSDPPPVSQPLSIDEISEGIQIPRNRRPAPQYPANAGTVIGVAANNSAGQLTYYSNQGEVMIAGGEIRHCDGNSNCLKTHGIIGKIPTDSGNQSITWEGIAWEGTSFAAPLVSGLAAKMLSCNPDLRPNQVRKFIDAELIPNPNLNLNVDDTNNPINVQNALAAAGCVSVDPPLDVSLICETGGGKVLCHAIASGGSGNNQFTWQADGGAIIVNASGSQATVNLGSCLGNPSVLVEVTDSSGNSDVDQVSLRCRPGRPFIDHR